MLRRMFGAKREEVARVGRGEAFTGFWWKNLRESDH
jgi:hypothetical protein